MSDEVHRTVVTRISPSDSDRQALERTIDQFREACQLATDIAWERCHRHGDVQNLAYDPIRERTSLLSQHAVLACKRAAEAVTGCVQSRAEGEQTSKPTFTAPSVAYDARCMTLFDDGTVSLSTVDGRCRVDLVLPDDRDGYQYQYLEDERWSLAESSLVVRDGSYYLHIGFKRSANTETTAGDGTVLGVDFGIENLAVTSTARFFPGSELSHDRRRFRSISRGLERTGTRSARETLERRSGRHRRHVHDELHRVSRKVVGEATEYGCGTIAVEELDGIQSRMPGAQRFHAWAFGTLRRFIEYKAREQGIEVVSVDPAGTSRRCADCGHETPRNRRSRARFRCEECGTEANADYNAAKNVALRHVRRGPQSSRRTGTRRCALKSGTVTPSGEFIPHPEGSEAESAGKPREHG